MGTRLVISWELPPLFWFHQKLHQWRGGHLYSISIEHYWLWLLHHISSCVGIQALLNMLMKKWKRLMATGLAVVSCAWHQLFDWLGVGNLQKGEWWVYLPDHQLFIYWKNKCIQCNIDYIFSSSIIGTNVQYLIISYDVRCQWFTNFWNGLPTSRNTYCFFMPPSGSQCQFGLSMHSFPNSTCRAMKKSVTHCFPTTIRRVLFEQKVKELNRIDIGSTHKHHLQPRWCRGINGTPSMIGLVGWTFIKLWA